MPIFVGIAWPPPRPNTLDSPVPQIRRNHILADIQVGLPAFAELQQPAAVHQHAASSGKYQQQAVALAHVDGRQFEYLRLNLRRPGMPHQQGEENQHQRTRGTPGTGWRETVGKRTSRRRVRSAPATKADRAPSTKARSPRASRRSSRKHAAAHRPAPPPSATPVKMAHEPTRAPPRSIAEYRDRAGSADQSSEGDAVKILGHRERKTDLNDGGDERHHHGQQNQA